MVFVGLLKAMPGSPTDYPSLKWYQTAAAAGCRGFSQTLLGKPEVFPFPDGIYNPSSEFECNHRFCSQLDGSKDPSKAAIEVGRLIRKHASCLF